MQLAQHADIAWTETRPSVGLLPRIDFAELWAYRELTYFLALRDLKLRYKQTALGIGWAVLQPLAGVLIFSITFGHLAKLPSEGIDYPVYVYAALAAWLYFSTAIDSGARSLIESRELVTKVYFPRVLAPFAAVLPPLLDLSFSLFILAAFMVIYGVAPPLALVLLPAWILLAVAVALGVSLWLSALNVLYRDVRYALTFIIQVWLFASPVVYPGTLVHGTARYFYSINPMVGVIDGFRWSLLGAHAPGSEILVSIGVTVLIAVTGLLYFQKVERRLADRI